MLFNATILFWLIDRLSEYMAGSWIFEISPRSLMYPIAIYASGASQDGSLLKELLFYASIKNGNSILWGFSGQGFIIEILSSFYNTIWFHWEQILVFWFFFEVAGFLSGASNQLTIEEVDFSDDSKKKVKKSEDPDGADGKPETSGMADLLAVNINRISELYRSVDEKRAIKSESGAGRPIDATLKSGDMSEILENSASEKSQISLGPISIPMGSITGLVGRIMQGPRISIALHKSKDKENKDYHYLTATLSGKEPYSWVVKDQKSLDGERDPRNIDDMVAELAHRIFAYMAFGDQGKLIAWRAVWNFNEGLRAYRDCLHSIKKRQYFLKQAEKYFIETVEEDDDLIQAYYNLGVVYTELNQFDSAEAAFSMRLRLRPQSLPKSFSIDMRIKCLT
jgi:tetratricopeptide (TPR) repeat protein